MSSKPEKYENIICEGCGAAVQASEITFVNFADYPRWLGGAGDFAVIYPLCPFCLIDPFKPIPFRVTDYGLSCLSNSTNLSTDEEL